jgi:hypothetical protein
VRLAQSAGAIRLDRPEPPLSIRRQGIADNNSVLNGTLVITNFSIQ